MKSIHLFCFILLMLVVTRAMAAPPTPNADARTIPSGSVVTINVLANDTDPDGDQLAVTAVSQPNSGVSRLNSDGSILYVAETGVAGRVVNFNYTVEDENGEVAQGEVIITLVEPNFAALAENLNDRNLADVLLLLCGDLRAQSAAALGVSRLALLQKCNRLENLRANNPQAFARALSQIAPEEVSSQIRIAADASRSQTSAVTTRVQQQKVAANGGQSFGFNQRSFALNGREWISANGSGGSAGADTPELWSRLGLFGSVQLSDAERERSELESGYEATAYGLTLGGDYFVNKSLLLGATISQNKNSVEYSNDAGELDGSLFSVGIFGAYFYQDLTAQLQLSLGWVDFESTRRIEFGDETFTVSEELSSDSVGTQQAVNARVDWSWQRKALSLTPFLRLDHLNSQINGFGEQGAGGLAMVLGEQKNSQTSVSLGLQSAYAFKPSWGVLIPTFGLSYSNEMQSSRDPVRARFAADVDASRAFSLNNDGSDTAYYELSVGASAQFKRGVSGFFEYTEILDYNYLDASQLQLGVRVEI